MMNEGVYKDALDAVALPPLLCADFINFLLQHQNTATTLVLCSSREAFLEELQISIQLMHPQSLAEGQVDDASASLHPLLIPTIHLIATSRCIRLAFVPTLPHLRAYLVASKPVLDPDPAQSIDDPSRCQTQLLAVWGMARLHRSTAEHSAQGLSRTLAIAVEAAKLRQQRLVLAESCGLDERNVHIPCNASGEPSSNIWKEQVPLLSGSIRFGGEERAWAGRTVEVGRVVMRWCKFIKVDYESAIT